MAAVQSVSFGHLAANCYRLFNCAQIRKHLSKALALGLFACFVLLPTSSHAADESKIDILNITDYQQDKQLLIDSTSHFSIPERVIDAVHHEIALNFKIEIQLTEASRFLGFKYQRTRKNVVFHTQLYAYGVSRQYTLYNSRNNKSQAFRTIDEALKTLATLQAFPVASLSELHPEQRYTLRMRISLDYWKLPTPLILEALFNDEWHLDSQWFETTLKTPLSWQ